MRNAVTGGKSLEKLLKSHARTREAGDTILLIIGSVR